MNERVADWRVLLEDALERRFGRDRAAAGHGQIDLAAECLARVDELWPNEWAPFDLDGDA